MTEKLENIVPVGNIQRFCLNDGPGIRTVIFLKGCNLRCPWCANPENMVREFQNFQKDGVIKTYGKNMSLKEIVAEAEKDALYYRTGGGITYSGGEPLLHFEALEPLLCYFKTKNISQCIETSLAASKERVRLAVAYMDHFFVDMKILIPEKANEILGLDVETYYNNLEFVMKSSKDVTIRIPLVKNYTFTEENLKLILECLRNYPKIKVQLFQVHNLAKSKYENLKKNYSDFEGVTQAEVDLFLDKLRSNDIIAEMITM